MMSNFSPDNSCNEIRKMDFHYIGLGSDLYKEIFQIINQNLKNNEKKSEKKYLYVFRNEKACHHFKDRYKKNIFFADMSNNIENSDENTSPQEVITNNMNFLDLFHNLQNDLILSQNEFYEKIFNNDKIVIKEEKQSLFFFHSLTDELKTKLNIKSYFDCIDIAYNYFNLFEELYKHEIDLKKNSVIVKQWQKEIIETLQEVDKIIKEKLNDNKLILPYMIEDLERLEENQLKKYDGIFIINKFDFTPKEITLYNKIKESGCNIIFVMQCDKDDFDKQNFKLTNNAFDNIKNDNISDKVTIHETNNNFNQMLALFKFLTEKEKEETTDDNTEINDGKKEKKRYYIYDLTEKEGNLEYNIFNSSKLKTIKSYSMNKKKIYKVLNILYNILANAEVIYGKTENEILYKVKDLFDAYKNNDFLKIFNICETRAEFDKLVQQNYKYISSKFLDDRYGRDNQNKEIRQWIEFFSRLNDIYEVDNLQDYTEILMEIFNSCEDAANQDVKDKFSESLSEIAVIDEFDFYKQNTVETGDSNERGINWGKYFDTNISSNLLKIFLKYLDAKKINFDEESNDYIFPYSEHSDLVVKNVVYINAQDTFPEIKVNEYLFSNTQRKQMRLPIHEDVKKIKSFQFLNEFYGAETVDIFYVKNLDTGDDLSGLIEDLKLKHDITNVLRNEVTEDDEINMIKKYINDSEEESEKKEFVQSKLEKTDKKLRLGYYDFNILYESEYDYYLEKHLNKTDVIEKIEDKIENKLLGILVHDIYEKVIENQRDNIKKKNIVIDEFYIEKIIKDVLSHNKYKISKKYEKFYSEITYDHIKQNVIQFLNEIKIIVEPLNNFEIYIEKKLYSSFKEFDNVEFAYKIDLLIVEGNGSVTILDYKTTEKNGNKNVADTNESKQLIFYEIMLRNQDISKPEEVLKLAPHFEAKHYIYNAIQGKMIPADTSKNFSDETIKEVLYKFNETDTYSLGEKKTFVSEKYKLISRREDENNGQ